MTIQNIKDMLLEDSHRWNCPNYNGLVVVPEKLVKETFDWIRDTLLTAGSCNPQRYSFRFDTDATLRVVHFSFLKDVESVTRGGEYTSILWSKDTKCGFEGINYAMTRLRSKSEHTSRFVMM